MSAALGDLGNLLVAGPPACNSVAIGLGMALVLVTLLLTMRVFNGLLQLLRAKLGHPEPSEPTRSRSAQRSVLDMARNLRHDSPGGWTAGETRWTLAHEHGWFTSPDYRNFIFSMVVLIAGWALGLRIAAYLCG